MPRLLTLIVGFTVVTLGCGPGADQQTVPPKASAKLPLDAKGGKSMPSEDQVVGKPWRSDPLLEGRFHPEYPDDLQVIVHDGGPRLTKNAPELMWGCAADTWVGFPRVAR